MTFCICFLVNMFGRMLRLVVWHSTICFLNRSNTSFIWIWWRTSMYNLFHVFEGHNIVCLIRFTFFIISNIVYSSLFPWKTWAFSLNMSKTFAFKTLDPIDILSFTIFSFMMKITPLGIVFLIVLNIWRDTIPRCHI